jgi:hypothetical protein
MMHENDKLVSEANKASAEYLQKDEADFGPDAGAASSCSSRR